MTLISQQRIPFVKMSGTGNDFLILDNRNSILEESAYSRLAQLLCRRQHSLGADGVIFIESSEIADFRWRFYNCDGSEAEMCGNGSRCVARYAYLRGLSKAHCRFESKVGIIQSQIYQDKVRVLLTNPKALRLNYNLNIDGRPLKVSSIDTGVPHAVIEVKNLQEFAEGNLIELGKTVRNHPFFQPTGTNVNFIEIIDSSSLRIRTYERGVENLTLSCGTGMVASAILTHAHGMTQSPVRIVSDGGVTEVFFECEDNNYSGVYLQGEARYLCEGEFTREALEVNHV